jgi:hypothetical protein
VVLQGQRAKPLHAKQGECDRKMGTEHTAMANTTADDPACGLLDLPTNVLLSLFDHVVAVENAGQLLRLALVRGYSELLLLLLLSTVVPQPPCASAAVQISCMNVTGCSVHGAVEFCWHRLYFLVQLLLCMHTASALAAVLAHLNTACALLAGISPEHAHGCWSRVVLAAAV